MSFASKAGCSGLPVLLALVTSVVSHCAHTLGQDTVEIAKGGTGTRQPAYSVESQKVRRVRAVYRAEYRTTGQAPDEWIVVTPQAPELPGTSTQVTTRLEPAGRPLRESDGEERMLLLSRVPVKDPATAPELAITITYEATLWARRLVNGQSASVVAPLTAEERQRYLAPTFSLEFQSGAFQKWLDRHELRRNPRESDVDLARRVFAAVLKQYPTTATERIPGAPVSVFCTKSEADCKVRSTVFAAAMRASGVPARVLCGIRTESKLPDAKGKITAHVRAEFFAESTGWVPVDVNWALADPQHNPQNRFGEDPGDMIIQYVDLDIMIPVGGEIVRSYMPSEPFAQARGKQSGSITFQVLSWNVETISEPTLESVPAAAAGNEVTPPLRPGFTPPARPPFAGRGPTRPPIPGRTGVQPPQPAMPNRPMIPTRSAPGPGTTVQQESSNLNYKPLGDGRWQIDMNYTDTSGNQQSRTLVGSKEELQQQIQQLAGLPPTLRDSMLGSIQRLGQPRAVPSRLPPTRGPRTP